LPAAHEPAITKSASTVWPTASCVISPTSEGESSTRLRPPSGYAAPRRSTARDAAFSASASGAKSRNRQSQPPVEPTDSAPRWISPPRSATAITRNSGRTSRVHARAPSLVTIPFSSNTST
jgi:hypothetical protein